VVRSWRSWFRSPLSTRPAPVSSVLGHTEADLGGGIVVFDPAQHASTTMIIPLTDTGTFTIGSWTETDVAVDVIGVFRAPTRTWRYEYDTTGMRTAKQLDNTAGTGAEWRKEHTWTAGTAVSRCC
jgi:YD repeat-containing protein